MKILNKQIVVLLFLFLPLHHSPTFPLAGESDPHWGQFFCPSQGLYSRGESRYGKSFGSECYQGPGSALRPVGQFAGPHAPRFKFPNFGASKGTYCSTAAQLR